MSAHSEDGSQLLVRLVPLASGAPAAQVGDSVAPQAGPTVGAAGPELVLPAVAVRAAALEVGSALTLRERGYGFELAQGEPRRAFFLLLREEALHELQTRPVQRAAALLL